MIHKLALALLPLAFSISAAMQTVVLYTALDRMHSEPVVKKFTEETGIKIKTVYDTEATKTAGLVNRLIAEKGNPRADVFWNNEIVHTIVLKNKGILAPYFSPNAKDIPQTFKDKEGYWTGFAARARIFIVNTEILKESEYPRSIFDFTKKEWKGRFCIANPLYGTTSTHVAVHFAMWGEKKAIDYYTKLKMNEVHVLAGNATNKDRVAAGILPAGFTDTDDANVAIKNGKKVAMVFPDQDDMGTLLIPNTVAMIKDCPNPQAARKLIDYILTPSVEELLAASRSAQIPVRAGIKGPEGMPPIEKLTFMEADFEKAAAELENATRTLDKLLN